MKVTQAKFKAQLLMGKSRAFIKQKYIHLKVREYECFISLYIFFTSSFNEKCQKK